MSDTNTYNGKFPYPVPRECQTKAIDFAMSEFRSGKKIVIIEAGTGVGKSAIGLTVARLLQSELADSDQFSSGAYFLTTQKILQEQYVSDFGCSSKNSMKSIKSSSNYTCAFHKKSTCAESLRALKVAEKGGRFWKKCTFDCTYRNAKQSFLESPESVTNFPYFLAETQYSGKIKPRKALIVDEAHNTPVELSKFVEVTMKEKQRRKD